MSDSESVVALLEQIAREGKRQGLTQAQIARRAGLAAETLSRAKRNPNIGLVHFARLARVVGLKLVLAPDDPLLEKIERGGLFER